MTRPARNALTFAAVSTPFIYGLIYGGGLWAGFGYVVGLAVYLCYDNIERRLARRAPAPQEE